jgi:hypothetical protein
MEHRCGRRHHLSMPVYVHDPGRTVWRAELANLSGGGAFLDLPGDIAAIRGFVELDIRLPGRRASVARWRALVVRRNASGVALMFEDRHDVEVRRIVREAHAAPRPPTRDASPGGRDVGRRTV